MTTATREQIAKATEKKLTDKGFFFGVTKEKLKGFTYCVATVKNEIGRVSFFDFDEELNNDDLDAIYSMIMQ